MNPLTNVKNINKLNELEAQYGVSSSASWHQQYKDSAYIFIGGLPYELTEGDVICVFSQYGEIVNINLVRDKKTGKSKGYCFIAYEDQRSTILAVDNFNGIKLKGRTLRVDHVSEYRKPKDDEELDEATQKLREEGCAPKTPPSQSEDEEEFLLLPPSGKGHDEKKKPKKEKKAKKKKKKKHQSSDGSDSDGPSTPPVKIKKEKQDPGYQKYEKTKGGEEMEKVEADYGGRGKQTHSRGAEHRDRDFSGGTGDRIDRTRDGEKNHSNGRRQREDSSRSRSQDRDRERDGQRHRRPPSRERERDRGRRRDDDDGRRDRERSESGKDSEREGKRDRARDGRDEREDRYRREDCYRDRSREEERRRRYRDRDRDRDRDYGRDRYR
ncbi:uncharacterized protein [Diadema antillarum]|uniref:uncharacterized protein n=1 Tax=Diadema antillarum TaxID=105358 RepID=UPI003A851D91